MLLFGHMGAWSSIHRESLIKSAYVHHNKVESALISLRAPRFFSLPVSESDSAHLRKCNAILYGTYNSKW